MWISWLWYRFWSFMGSGRPPGTPVSPLPLNLFNRESGASVRTIISVLRKMGFFSRAHFPHLFNRESGSRLVRGADGQREHSGPVL